MTSKKLLSFARIVKVLETPAVARVRPAPKAIVVLAHALDSVALHTPSSWDIDETAASVVG